LAATNPYIVSQRSRDIGVRVALGASARAIGGLVLRLFASLAIGRVIESLLF